MHGLTAEKETVPLKIKTSNEGKQYKQHFLTLREHCRRENHQRDQYKESES